MSKHVVVESGEFAGWRTWSPADPFEAHAGPFHHRQDPDGSVRCAFRVERRHLNGLGTVHGGCLMTFADHALFAIAWPEIGDTGGVTVHLAGDFLSPGREGDLIEARGDITRAARSLVFARGELFVADRCVLPFSGIIKRIKGAG